MNKLTLAVLKKRLEQSKTTFKIEKFDYHWLYKLEYGLKLICDKKAPVFDDDNMTYYAALVGQCFVDIFDGEWLDPEKTNDLCVLLDPSVGHAGGHLSCIIKPQEVISDFLRSKGQNSITRIYHEFLAVKKRNIGYEDLKTVRKIHTPQQVLGKSYDNLFTK